MPPSSPELRPVGNLAWTNWHETDAVEAARHVRLFYTPFRPFSPEGFRQSADLVLDFIEQARQAGATIRAVGSAWSFSKISAQENCWLLDTSAANRKKRFTRGELHPEFSGDPDSLLLCQCGTTIHAINQYLERKRGRSLVSVGASNGQTIVGAMSTGTHGSAFRHGAIQSQVVAIQLLTVDGKNLWIERPGEKIVRDEFAQSLGATAERRDDLFDAALVSLGMLGVIHAVVIRSQPLFLLSASQFEHPRDGSLKDAMETLDLTHLTIPPTVQPDGDAKEYFFQLVVNPYDPDGPARVKVMYDIGWPDDDYEIDYSQQGKWGVAFDLPGFVGGMLDSVEELTPAVVSAMFKRELPLFDQKKGTVGQTFNFTSPLSRTVGAALAVPAADGPRALELALEAHREAGPAPVGYACRFVQQTRGYLSFTRFDPTCVIDIDGLVSQNTETVMEAVRTAFDAHGIDYTQHWGKFHDYRQGRLERSYGADLEAFLGVRRELLPTEADRRTFALAAPETAIGALS